MISSTFKVMPSWHQNLNNMSHRALASDWMLCMLVMLTRGKDCHSPGYGHLTSVGMLANTARNACLSGVLAASGRSGFGHIQSALLGNSKEYKARQIMVAVTIRRLCLLDCLIYTLHRMFKHSFVCRRVCVVKLLKLTSPRTTGHLPPSFSGDTSQ